MAAHPAAQASEPLHLTSAEILFIDGFDYSSPSYFISAPINADAPAANWKQVTLPHALRPDHSLLGLSKQSEAPTQITWYKVSVAELAQTQPPYYLYIPRWKSDGQVAVYGDGRLLYQSHANLQWNGSNHPLLIALDGTADAKPPSEILIRMQHLRGIGGALSTLWAGNYPDLAWRYTAREWLQTQLPFMCSAAFLAIGIFSFFVWLSRRREKLYLLFFLMSLAAYIRTFHEYVGLERLPISDEWFGWLTVNSLFWLIAISHLFLLQLHRRAQPWLTKLVLLVSASSTFITLPLPGMPDATLSASPIYVALLLVGNVVYIFAFRNAWLSRSKDGLLLAGWSLICMQLGIHDWLLQNNFISIEGAFLGTYANMGVFILFTYVMFRRYLAAISEVEKVNGSLEVRLQARETELTQSHHRLREIEHRQTLVEERQRLMRDMHDGLGSSLVSALRVVEHGRLDETEVAHVLKGCIDDLKLAIDSLEPVDADLLLLLATLRFRLGPHLESTGIALRWEVKTVPALDWLAPKCALHILRILQEAFTNIIKHAQATEIRVATDANANWVQVTITDNGQGFDVVQGLGSAGKGLSNQVRRAESIGAEILWISTAAGTRLTLRLPIKRPSIAIT
ncbi:MAG: sensor histidine kinase [Glaciimonas sp.]|nr:sensor histidine kinase [Glaciimonas sp.]